MSLPRAFQGQNQPKPISKASEGLKRNLPPMHQIPISLGYDVCMGTNTTHTTSQIELADCPADGGKWVIYCDHYDADNNPIGTGLLQDTNKRRLAQWRNHSDQWCPLCQEESN